MRFRLGDVTFDGDRRQLLRGQEPVELSPEARHLLEFLIEKSPRAVSTKELQRVLWSDETVPEWRLLAVVSELRRALADDLDQPRFIRHVHGFGYAFEGESSPAEEPLLATPHRLVLAGREFPLEEGENIMGRDPGCFCVDDGTVSRRHARITVSGGSATLEDLGSKNGTWWREARLETALALTDGDEFSVGSVRVVYRGPGGGLEEAGISHVRAEDLEVAVVEPIRGSIPGGGRHREIVHPEVTLDMFLASPADLSAGPPTVAPRPMVVSPPPVPRKEPDVGETRDDEEGLAGKFE